MKKLFLMLLVLIFGFSCSALKQTHKAPLPAHLPPVVAIAEDSLTLAEKYVSLARQAEQISDTLGADYYFSKAMDITDRMRQSGKDTLNPDARQKIQEVSLEYARYLQRLNGIEHDTLSAANAMKVLTELEERTEKNDSANALVSIPDVIENKKPLAIPLVLNHKVEKAITYFRTKGRRVFTRWLQRAGRYRPMIRRILREEGVPEELLYLGMIESGFNPYARSYARAVGIWQFIYSTGRAYGLRRSWWYDERRDPEKATRAAARHLKDLHERFNNWYLAIAGYNFSPGKIERRIRRYKNVDEFWELPRLPRQTRNYVPTFIAATLMAKNPEKYGFYVTPDPPVEYDTVTVRETVDLNVVAQCTNSSFSEIKKLNPALLRWCTPPDRDRWVLNIPKGTREQFLENYAKVPDSQKFTWIHHRIRSGETLSTIARHYGVNMSEIKRFNKIRGSFIRAGQHLVIPVPQNKKYYARLKRKKKSASTGTRRRAVTNVPGRTKLVHTVQKGETLWALSRKYKVSVSQIRRWNGLGYSRIIRPGKQLNIWLPKSSPDLAMDNSRPPRPTDPPQTAEASKKAANGHVVYYTVRSGDNLWDIANRYGVSIRDIKRWNGRRSNLIKPGDRLKINLPD